MVSGRVTILRSDNRLLSGIAEFQKQKRAVKTARRYQHQIKKSGSEGGIADLATSAY
jgi:hypothetical protein